MNLTLMFLAIVAASVPSENVRETVTFSGALLIAVVSSLLAVAASVITHAWVGSNNAKKFEGVMQATVTFKFAELDKDVRRLEKVDGEQWDQINAIRNDTQKLEGRVIAVETRCREREVCG